MSIVRYVNKKTGAVSLYESTSHYDPETKQSRPIRKYLGREDPETGELIPSSGKRGRKPKSQGESSESDALVNSLQLQINDLKKEIAQQEQVIQSLERKNQELIDGFQSMSAVIHRTLDSVNFSK